MTSSELYREACQKIPGGVSSPVRAFRHVGMEPLYFSKASGPYLYDVEERPFVDFCLSFGPHILGHGPAPVVKAIQAQAELGTSFGACHPKEVELASLILKGYPFLEMVRLVNSGTEAVMTAVRLARGFTGRDKIVTFEGCYHGHSDGFLAKAGSGVAELSEATSQGVPRSVVSDTIVARFEDAQGLEEIFQRQGNQIAAILLELIPGNHGLLVPTHERIQEIFALAKKYGALVIADEVITGFRVGLSGASGYFDVTPDLVTLGKIIGGGLPLAAVVGKRAIMEKLAPLGPVYQAGTLSGNALATSAGVAMLSSLFAAPPYAALASATQSFSEKFQQAASREFGTVQLRHFASMFWLHFGEIENHFPPTISNESRLTYAKFFKRCLDEGLYLPPSPYEVCFLSTAHTPNILGDILENFCDPTT